MPAASGAPGTTGASGSTPAPFASSSTPAASAAVSPATASSRPPASGSAQPGAPASAPAAAGSCSGTTAAAALDAERAKIRAAYDRDRQTTESFRAQGGDPSKIDAVEAQLATQRDAGLAAVTAKAGTGCLDANAMADLDSATSAAVSAIDAVMPSPSGGQQPPPSGGQQPPGQSGGGTSGGVFGSGGASTAGLAACPSGTSFLDASPAGADGVSYVDPLGHMSGAHVLPDQADHIYFYMRDPTQLTPVYSPGQVTLIAVVSQKHFDPTNPSVGSTDYELDFSPCRSVLFWFAHVSHVSDRVAGALKSFPSPTCQTFTLGNSGTTSCNYPNLDLALSSGEQIGAAGGPGAGVLAFDFGGIDTRAPAQGFLDTEIAVGTMPDSFAHTVCPPDYFTDPVKSALYAELRNAHPGVNGIPACGTTMQDKAGTLQGNWYRRGAYTPGANGPFDFLDALAIVHSNNDPTLGVISAGGRLVGGGSGQQIAFQPRSSGSIDREPSQVTPGPTVYCYQDAQQPGGRFDLQLVDANTLQIDYVAGSTCAASPTLTNPATYTR